MTLPRRIAKPSKRASRWRSQAHLNFVRSFECCIGDCGERPIEAAHVRFGTGTGMGQKPDDWNAVSMCVRHHAHQHALGEQTFWRIAKLNPADIIEAFINASPKRREIEQVRSERHGPSHN